MTHFRLAGRAAAVAAVAMVAVAGPANATQPLPFPFLPFLPQPAEMQRMLKLANDRIAQQDEWIKARRARINGSLARLDADFDKLLVAK